jgi:hypothetical protein
MQANPRRSTSRGDWATQRAMLALVLAGFPVLRTIPELTREIGDGDAVERAASELVGHGVLERRGATLIPTPTTLRCHHLDSW